MGRLHQSVHHKQQRRCDFNSQRYLGRSPILALSQAWRGLLDLAQIWHKPCML